MYRRTKTGKGTMRTLLVVALLGVPLLASGNDAHNILMGMSDANRKTAFAGLLNASNESCGQVTQTFFHVIDGTGAAQWAVRCSNKRAYLISVANDKGGSTRILDCATLKLMTKMDCFAEWKDNTGRPKLKYP
jgi:hypothetical protein